MPRLRGTVVALCAGLLAGTTALAAAPDVPVYREFKDWIVGCDNTRACTAKSAPERDGPGQEGNLRFRREAGPRGQVEMTLSSGGDSDASMPRLDGRALPEARWLREGGAPKRDDALKFIRALSDGNALQLASDPSASVVSLRGLAAALLFIDEVQGRVGHATAFVRPGQGAASEVPSAPALPVVRAAPPPRPLPDAARFAGTVRASQEALLKQRCDANLHDFSEDEALPLNRDEALVLLSCWRAAYQSGVLVLRAPRSSPQKAVPVVLPLPPGAPAPREKDGNATTVSGSYSPETATLNAFYKGRGLADCGASSSWVFDGRDFQPSEYVAQPRCTGGEPGDWLPMYRTRTVKGRSQ